MRKSSFCLLLISLILLFGCNKNDNTIDITFKGSIISYRTVKQPEESWADVAYLATIKNNSTKDFIYRSTSQEHGAFAMSGINEGEIFQMKADAPFPVLKVLPGDSLNILLYGRGGNMEEEFNLQDYENTIVEENKRIRFYFSPGPKLHDWKFKISKASNFSNEKCLFNRDGNALPNCITKFWKK